MILSQQIPTTLYEALAIIIPGAMASIFGFVKWYLPWRRRSKTERKSVRELRAIQKIYSIMHECIVETAAERVIIFAGHDSGNLPKAGSPFFISSIYWKVRHDSCNHNVCIDTQELDIKTHQDIADYKEVNADEHYIEMLLNIIEKGTTRIDVDSLPEDSILSSYYKMEGVTDSIVIYLGHNTNNLIYMSIATFAEGGFSQDDIVRAKLKALNIKNELGFSEIKIK